MYEVSCTYILSYIQHTTLHLKLHNSYHAHQYYVQTALDLLVEFPSCTGWAEWKDESKPKDHVSPPPTTRQHRTTTDFIISLILHIIVCTTDGKNEMVYGILCGWEHPTNRVCFQWWCHVLFASACSNLRCVGAATVNDIRQLNLIWRSREVANSLSSWLVLPAIVAAIHTCT